LKLPHFSSANIARVLLAAVLGGLLATAQAVVPVYDYVVKQSYPHDPQAFTQGLVYRDGFLYESTGMNGRSSIRKVELTTGKVLQQRDIPSIYFGEGITLVGKEIISLTWTSQQGFGFDLETFAPTRKWNYRGEGWGLATGDGKVFMSDGSNVIRVLDPVTLAERSRIRVTADGVPVDQLNEMEWVEGELYANIWQTDRIARIDPATGNVVGWIDLSGLLAPKWRGIRIVDVLNGIAYDGAGHRLFVTGKLWPRVFEITLVPRAKP
jgi:glutamine cyclotransferase